MSRTDAGGGETMRALRIVGLDEEGTQLILEDPVRGERYSVPADDRLKAAARGDVTRLGQAQIELESQMRPREIQARIRAGESVEQVAAAAGLPAQRVERFAYPVLLERSRTAELAQHAHPMRDEGADVQTLAEVVNQTFGLRGQDHSTARWDSWRGDDGKWIVELRWKTGRSENRAHWTFHPGAHGGTVVALDDTALELLNPQVTTRPLRTVRAVTELARQALEHAAPPAGEPEILAHYAPHPVTEPEPEPEVDEVADFEPFDPALAEPPVAVVPEPEPEPVAEPEVKRAAPVRKEPAAPKRGKKNHPIVPSWEDVLLGVRSNRG